METALNDWKPRIFLLLSAVLFELYECSEGGQNAVACLHLMKKAQFLVYELKSKFPVALGPRSFRKLPLTRIKMEKKTIYLTIKGRTCRTKNQLNCLRDLSPCSVEIAKKIKNQVVYKNKRFRLKNAV